MVATRPSCCPPSPTGSTGPATRRPGRARPAHPGRARRRRQLARGRASDPSTCSGSSRSTRPSSSAKYETRRHRRRRARLPTRPCSSSPWVAARRPGRAVRRGRRGRRRRRGHDRHLRRDRLRRRRRQLTLAIVTGGTPAPTPASRSRTVRRPGRDRRPGRARRAASTCRSTWPPTRPSCCPPSPDLLDWADYTPAAGKLDLPTLGGLTTGFAARGRADHDRPVRVRRGRRALPASQVRDRRHRRRRHVDRRVSARVHAWVTARPTRPRCSSGSARSSTSTRARSTPPTRSASTPTSTDSPW